MLTKADIQRFDSIMAAVMKKREDRGFNIPDRDEDKIAEILDKWEKSAKEMDAAWLEEIR